MIFFQIIAIYMYYDLDKDVPFCFVKNSELSKQICNVSGKSSIKKKKKEVAETNKNRMKMYV